MKRYCCSGKKNRDKQKLWGLLLRYLTETFGHGPGHPALGAGAGVGPDEPRWPFQSKPFCDCDSVKSEGFLLKYVSICALSSSLVPWNTLLRWKTQVHCHLRHISPVFSHQCQFKGEMWSALLEGELILSHCCQSLWQWVVFLPFTIEYN